MISTNQLLTKAQSILVVTADRLSASDPSICCKIETYQHSFFKVASSYMTEPHDYIDRITFEICYESHRAQLLIIERQGDYGCIRCQLQRKSRSGNPWSGAPFSDQLMTAVNKIRQIDPDAQIILQSSVREKATDVATGATQPQ